MRRGIPTWKAWTTRFLGAALVLGLAAATRADGPAPGEAPRVFELTLHPAPAPPSARQYALLPTFAERTPGNAVPIYFKAFSMMRSDRQEDYEQVTKWLEMPVASLPVEECRELLDRYRDAFVYLDIAARREHCDWDPPIRELGREVVGLLLPEVQNSRFAARLTELRTRLAIVEKRYDDALASLRTGYALARHVAQQPTLVSTLVAVTIVSYMNEELRELLAQPGAPNLYWAITVLPDPLVDAKPGLDFEANFIYLTLPEMQPAQRAALSAAQWKELGPGVLKGILVLSQYSVSTPAPAADEQEKIVQDLLKAAPQAKADLIAAGFAPNVVEAMEPAQAVVLDYFRLLDAYHDVLARWYQTPYWQAVPQLKAAEEHFFGGSQCPQVVTLLKKFVPDLILVPSVGVFRSRQMAMYRCVEAIRLYAAGHDGKLPARLEDIREVPIPHDPVTGQAFPYRLEGDVAVLVGEAFSHYPSWTMRLQMAR